MVQWLLDKGADIDTQDINGWTALMRAVYGGQSEIVFELIRAGADFEPYIEKPIVQQAIRELWPPQRLLEREIGMREK